MRQLQTVLARPLGQTPVYLADLLTGVADVPSGSALQEASNGTQTIIIV
jgi:hypothetical protein